jgi:SlyX protein
MDIETRISRIEERLTWLQRHVVEQDRVISVQTFEIDTLKSKLVFMKKQMDESAQPEGSAPDERPPHY